MNVTKWVPGQAWSATFTIGTESGNVVNVAIQLKDFAGNDLAVANSVLVYLASNSTGLDFHGASVTTETAIGTDGSLAILLAKVVYLITSEADGDIDINITDTSADTYYVVVVMPNGKLEVSTVVTLAG